ncbi:glycoside hydrolase family 18 protein, partial [Canariomyces notabilis]
CDSGKCIRSHVNLTKTRNMLAMVMKAGVPRNKIFVGEASYSRSFHMAKDGWWEAVCDFTGTLTQSDPSPGKCAKTAGYFGYAEV